MKSFKKFAALAAAPLAAALLLTGCSAPGSNTTSDAPTESASGEPRETVRYSKSQGPYTELFETAIRPMLEEDGWSFESHDVSELLNANIALAEGDVDFNVEQHTAYMEDFNANHGSDLVAITSIPTVPAGIYSEHFDTLDEIADGATVALPDDPANAARAYLLLEKIGWITLDEDAELGTVSKNDVTENPHNLEFLEMKSLTIPTAAVDFDYYVLTGSIVYNAGIDASTALATEDVLDHLVLKLVVRDEDADAEWAQAIVDAYHSDEFADWLDENNDGLWWIPAELQR